MPSNEVEYQILSGVLDGLDDLYDRREPAEEWLERLLTASSVALSGTAWEERMADAARGLRDVLLRRDSHDKLNAHALDVTGELRVRIADRWSELHPKRPVDE